MEDEHGNAPSPDELAIYIDSQGNYKVAIPNGWAGNKMPEFAYLAAACVLRLARKDEIEFTKSMARWAKESLDRDGVKRKPPQLKN